MISPISRANAAGWPPDPIHLLLIRANGRWSGFGPTGLRALAAWIGQKPCIELFLDTWFLYCRISSSFQYFWRMFPDDRCVRDRTRDTVFGQMEDCRLPRPGKETERTLPARSRPFQRKILRGLRYCHCRFRISRMFPLALTAGNE
ncbi:hypothetical protein [Rhizobium sp. Leaf453]|uniref:hypothetical protein n=1 Tax=Rhizobium sp. Leaf453 TaxID=1736380 RepID=UPI0012E2FE21|nr:hypothetical protein [Rhizobium sp. Leaf453]